MNKKQQTSRRGRRRAALGLAVCFIAAVGLTGIYTWSRYKDRMEQEMELAKEEQEKLEENWNLTEETGTQAEKAEDEEENAEMLPEDTQEESENEQQEEWQQNSSAQTSGTASVAFGENSQLLWPVDGHVMMSYSMDQTVYFATLDQYKYNPALIISGAVNDNVIAAAPGTVKSIDESPQTGKTITIDMGSGYECLYGQLKEIPVYVGDYVEAGTVIGYLAEPTKYYSLEGCNLYFELRKDAQPINPMDFLAEE